MRAAAQMTLTTSGLIIGIAAVGLVRVIFHLRAIQANLAGTTGAVETVAAVAGVGIRAVVAAAALIEPRVARTLIATV